MSRVGGRLPFWTVLTFSVTIFTDQASAFFWTLQNNANFAECSSKLQNISDPVAYNRSHPGAFYNAAERLLTLGGCEDLCGKEYGTWPIGDIIDRFSLWLLPGLILITHFSFAPLGVSNYVKVVVHAVGDPIDSIWSILTRFEINRQLLRIAKKCVGKCVPDNQNDEGDPDRSSLAEHLAAIWAAYEESSWQDASSHFIEVIESRVRRGEEQIIKPPERTHIRETSHRLSSMRQTSLVLTLIPIFSLAIGLITAIVRTIYEIGKSKPRIINETAHTIALVSLLFIFTPLVAFSGSLGSFLTVNGAAEAIHKMRCELRIKDSLFPEMATQTHTTCACLLSGTDDTGGLEGDKPTAASASYSGVPLNSSWRPCKHVLPSPALNDEKIPVGSRSRGLLLGYSLSFVLLGSCVPAIFLSATNHVDKRKVRVGCRTLSWLTIMALWVCSPIIDSILFWSIHRKSSRLVPGKVELVWDLTVLKDFVIVSVITILTAFEQTGFYNNCWCRSSFSDVVNLNQFKSDEWRRAKILWGTIAPCFFLFNLVLIGWVLLVGGGKTGVLCKSRKTLRRDGESISLAVGDLPDRHCGGP